MNLFNNNGEEQKYPTDNETPERKNYSYKEFDILVKNFKELTQRYANDPDYLPTESELNNKVRVLLNVRYVDGKRGLPGEEVHILALESTDTYEIFSKEYIQRLASFLTSQECLKLFGNVRPVRILEVGAGKGKLGHHLQKFLNVINPELFEVTMVDIRDDSPEFVEKIDVEAAIAKYNAPVILSSWMPFEEDWTVFFRNNPNTKMYILIGDDSCGGVSTWNDTDEFKSLPLEIGTLYGRGFIQGHLGLYGGGTTVFIRTNDTKSETLQ